MALYVLTTLHYSSLNIYKVGFHSSSIENLINKYRSINQEPIILFYSAFSQANILLQDMKLYFDKYFLKNQVKNNQDNKKTNWIQIEYSLLIDYICKYNLKFIENNNLSQNNISLMDIV